MRKQGYVSHHSLSRRRGVYTRSLSSKCHRTQARVNYLRQVHTFFCGEILLIYRSKMTDEATINAKLDKILTFNCKISETLNNLKIELTDKMNELSDSLTKRIKSNENDIIDLKSSIEPLQVKANQNANETEKLRKELNKHIQQVKKEAVLRDLKSRELNIMIGNIPDSNKWEDRNQSMKLVRNFLANLFSHDDNDHSHYNPGDIVIVDAHRVPQNPIKFFTSTQKKKSRTLIFKVQTYMEMKTIMMRAKNLKKINEHANQENRIYIKRHLPRIMQDQEQQLRPKFNDLRGQGKKPKFSIDFDTAEIYIEVDGKNVATAPKI